MSARQIDDPQPGFFKMRLVRGGPFVGACISYGPPSDPETGGILEERSYLWEARINGELVRTPSPDPAKAGVFRIWHSGTEISEPECRFLIADAEWVRMYAADTPSANPKQPVDLANMPAEHFRPRR